MVKRKIKQIIRTKREDVLRLKYQLNYLLLKSILHNRTIKTSNKSKLSFYFTNKNFFKLKKICSLDGQFRSIDNKLKLSRYNLNYLAKSNHIPNLKSNSF